MPDRGGLEEQLADKAVLALGGVWVDEWAFPSWGVFDRTGQLWADIRRQELSKGLV